MREIAGLGERLPHRLVAVFQQGVEVVDQRLHFCGIRAEQLALLPGANVRQAPAHRVEGMEASAHQGQAAYQAGDRDDDADAGVAVDHRRGVPGMGAEREDDGDDDQKTDGPQDRTHHHAAAKRARTHQSAPAIR